MIAITYPNKHSKGGPEETIRLDWVEGKTLKMYLHETQLSGVRTHCRVDVKNSDGYFERIRGSYVPKDGDVIRLRRTGGMS